MVVVDWVFGAKGEECWTVAMSAGRMEEGWRKKRKEEKSETEANFQEQRKKKFRHQNWVLSYSTSFVPLESIVGECQSAPSDAYY